MLRRMVVRVEMEVQVVMYTMGLDRAILMVMEVQGILELMEMEILVTMVIGIYLMVIMVK